MWRCPLFIHIYIVFKLTTLLISKILLEVQEYFYILLLNVTRLSRGYDFYLQIFQREFTFHGQGLTV